MSYGLELSHQAKKILKVLDKATIKRIEKRFAELSLAPQDFRHSQPEEECDSCRNQANYARPKAS